MPKAMKAISGQAGELASLDGRISKQARTDAAWLGLVNLVETDAESLAVNRLVADDLEERALNVLGGLDGARLLALRQWLVRRIDDDGMPLHEGIDGPELVMVGLALNHLRNTLAVVDGDLDAAIAALAAELN